MLNCKNCVIELENTKYEHEKFCSSKCEDEFGFDHCNICRQDCETDEFYDSWHSLCSQACLELWLEE